MIEAEKCIPGTSAGLVIYSLENFTTFNPLALENSFFCHGLTDFIATTGTEYEISTF
jgi:hypothetical protein